MAANLRDFSLVEFSPAVGPGFVYVLLWVSGDDEEIPFYVGETQSIWGCLNDYYWAQFQAPTDFRVGEAINTSGLRNFVLPRGISRARNAWIGGKRNRRLSMNSTGREDAC
jgi:hypothetical protein